MKAIGWLTLVILGVIAICAVMVRSSHSGTERTKEDPVHAKPAVNTSAPPVPNLSVESVSTTVETSAVEMKPELPEALLKPAVAEVKTQAVAQVQQKQRKKKERQDPLAREALTLSRH